MKMFGMKEESISVLLHTADNPSKEALEYQRNNPDKKVVLMKDERTEDLKSYIPSIKPHGMMLLSRDHKPLIDGHNLFYHDSDIMFNRPVSWDFLVKDPLKCYMSDTVAYIGAEYIISKSPELLNLMADVVGIKPVDVYKRQKQSGGAQYIFGSGIDHTPQFWGKVMEDSLKLYRLMQEVGQKYKKPEDPYPIQAWTAEMWAQLWNTWYFGYESEVIEEMNFTWPMNPIHEIFTHNIYHNAGVGSNDKDLFFKGKYIDSSPIGEDLSFVNPLKASKAYAQMIMECSKAATLL